MIEDMGVVYMMNKTGPKTEPWGTPKRSGEGSEEELLIDTY